jgi:DNA polymerase-3 subunit alpha
VSLEKLEHEFAAIGFYLSSHPLAGYKTALERMGVVSSSMLEEKLNSQYRQVKLAGIVTGRKFKVSDKGRFAFIQLSDLGGIFEVSVFNEALLNEHRDHLENGKILLIQADAKIDESGMRLIAQKITPFDEAWAQAKAKGGFFLRIVVNQTEALTSIRNLLGEPNGQGTAITLSAQLDRQQAEVQLPGKYTVSPDILDKIRVLKGVVSAEEIAA